MAWPRRVAVIMIAFIAGNFLAVNVALAGKVLVDFSNLQHYASSGAFGGPFVGYVVLVLSGTIENCLIVLPPTLLVLIFTEILRVRAIWFYVVAGAVGAFLVDVVCSTNPGLIGMRSFCVTLSLNEVAIVTIAGAAAGFIFWRIAGNHSGEWRSRMRFNSSAAG